MKPEITKLLTLAFARYLDEHKNSPDPKNSYLSYDFDFIKTHHWSLFGREIIEYELNELTNILNRWCNDLRRWHTWNKILKIYDEKDSWKIQKEFVVGLVNHCLIEPSSIRDRFTYVATNSFHQVRLSSENNYKDYLEGDPKSSNKKPKRLIRKMKEHRLSQIISAWVESKPFLESHASINDEPYKKATHDYRNRISHALPPQLEIGITPAVTRQVVQATQLVKQVDGTYREESISGKLSVSYQFAVEHPISLDESWQLNLQQFQLARKCYNQFLDLLELKVKSIPKK